MTNNQEPSELLANERRLWLVDYNLLILQQYTSAGMWQSARDAVEVKERTYT